MRTYKVNKIEHDVFDPGDILPEGLNVLQDWREGRVGDWVMADDDCIIQILRRGTMLRRKGKEREVGYVGTCAGTFIVKPHIKMDTSRRPNIYSLGGHKTPEEIVQDRKDLNSYETLFLSYMAGGMSPGDAYVEAFPTKNRKYGFEKASQLLQTERIQTAMKEELKPVCEKLGVDPESIIKGIKDKADFAEKDETQLKALFKLSDILDLEDKNQTKVTQVTGALFKGFTPDELESAERPKLKE